MKIIIFILFSSLLLETVAAGERLSDIPPGVPCDKIPETERRLGSLESAVDDAQGISKYAGTHGGKKATIVYRCDRGRMTEQRVIVMSTTRDEAYRFANEQKSELSKRLGDPVHDGLELAVWKRLFFGFLGADLDYLTRVVVWGRAKEDVMLSITETGAHAWEVSISQGSSKLEYILNS